MEALKKKQVKKEIIKIVKTNDDFYDFLDNLLENYSLHSEDEENTLLLQEHLTNMSVIFNQMRNNVK